jgi:magnesium transporter
MYGFLMKNSSAAQVLRRTAESGGKMVIFKSKKKVGLSPGSLVYVGNRTDEPVRISIMDYSPDHLDEFSEATAEDIHNCMAKDSVTWINISGIHDMAIVEKIGEMFNLHPLLMEDLVNTHHRSKIDDYEDYLFLVLKMVFQEPGESSLLFEHVCLVIGPNYLISFQEREGDVFGPVRERLKKSKGRIRKSGSDYLGYALIDMIVDHYYVVLEKMGENFENIQEEALESPTAKTLNDIHEARHQVVLLRKTIWPMREMVGSLLRGTSDVFHEDIMIYLRDVYDHTIQVIDTVETYRDLLASTLDTYMSSVSNKMNEIMKVLTVIATLFIPLTFLAGVYGMNFKYMPELEWRYAYPAFWVMVIVCLSLMFWWFKTKKWL